MKAFVNLSSQPFRNRRLFWVVILLLFVIPSYFGLQAINTLAQREDELADRNQAIKKVDAELNKVQGPTNANVTVTTDQNRQLVAASELVARRAFSWSQL